MIWIKSTPTTPFIKWSPPGCYVSVLSDTNSVPIGPIVIGRVDRKTKEYSSFSLLSDGDITSIAFSYFKFLDSSIGITVGHRVYSIATWS